MNSPDKNNYIQYVNKNGIVKATNVVFDNDGTTTKFSVSGIDEDFFIFAVYENNIQIFCVGLENLDNTDMLGFLNANMVDLSCIPPYAFLPQYTVVELSYNNEYVQKNKFGVSSGGGLVFPEIQNVKVISEPYFNDITYQATERLEDDDLKWLKNFLYNYYGSLDGFFIEPYYINMTNNTSYFPYFNTILFGRLTGSCVYKDRRFGNGQVEQNRNFNINGQAPMFVSDILATEGMPGFTFVGYKVQKEGWLQNGS